MLFDLPNVKTVVDLRGKRFKDTCAPPDAHVIKVDFISTMTGLQILKVIGSTVFFKTPYDPNCKSIVQ